MSDASFRLDHEGLAAALSMLSAASDPCHADLPQTLPETGIGEARTLERLAPHVLGRAARLDAPLAFAHMDPPTPWITWALNLWNARLNQNLLHPATAPFARDAERLVVDWLVPFFGMQGGHMTPGSTIANLTALWVARDAAGAKRVVASEAAHVSIKKSAILLGLEHRSVPVDREQRIRPELLGDLSDACLVLTAGTTAAGAIDPLVLEHRPAWLHVDAAWAGPLRLTDRYEARLAGIETADSVAVSAHKWLFQPKESALVLFRELARANWAMTFGGGYLAAPNIGLLGSHGAAAVPLLGTLLAWGRKGLALRIERCMAMAERLAEAIDAAPGLELFAEPQTGVVVFRPIKEPAEELAERVAPEIVSTTTIAGENWLRCVAANPEADIERVLGALGLR